MSIRWQGSDAEENEDENENEIKWDEETNEVKQNLTPLYRSAIRFKQSSLTTHIEMTSRLFF